MLLRGTITNAPHIPRVRALLDAPALVRNPVATFEKYRRELGHTFSVHLGGARPAIVSTNPSFVHEALHKTGTYHVSTVRVDRMAEFQGRGLINSHGAAWLQKRRFLSHTVHRERLEMLMPHQQRVLADLLTKLEQRLATDPGPVDLHQLMTHVISHMVARSIFGARMTDDQIDQIIAGIRTVQGFVLRQIFQPYLIPWFRVSGRSSHYQRIRAAADQIARDYIRARSRSPGNGGDILEMLLTTPYDESGEPLSDEQILIECMQFLVAGSETSPIALSWTLYLLARHPRFVREIRDEVESVFGSGPATLASLQRLRLTRRVVDEAMRLYSPFWMIDRVAVEEDEIEGIHIPRGVMVLPYIWGMHRDPRLWPDPEVFDPSRFEDEAVRSRHPSAHSPFGGGPRKCIGSNMAILQMLLVLAELIRRYDVQLASTQAVEIDPRMILHPKGPIAMWVRRVTPSGCSAYSGRLNT
jgi:cytochrome P450